MDQISTLKYNFLLDLYLECTGLYLKSTFSIGVILLFDYNVIIFINQALPEK